MKDGFLIAVFSFKIKENTMQNKVSIYDNTINFVNNLYTTIKNNKPFLINNYQKYFYFGKNQDYRGVISFEESETDFSIELIIKNKENEMFLILSKDYFTHVIKYYCNENYNNILEEIFNNYDYFNQLQDEIVTELEYMENDYKNLKISNYKEFRKEIYKLIENLEFKFLETDKSIHKKLEGFQDNELNYIIEKKDSLSEYSINIQTTIFNNIPQTYIDIYNIDNKILEYTGKLFDNQFYLEEIGYSLNTLDEENWEIIYKLLFINIDKTINELTI
jgi:hypothetical protein